MSNVLIFFSCIALYFLIMFLVLRPFISDNEKQAFRNGVTSAIFNIFSQLKRLIKTLLAGIFVIGIAGIVIGCFGMFIEYLGGFNAILRGLYSFVLIIFTLLSELFTFKVICLIVFLESVRSIDKRLSEIVKALNDKCL